MSSQHRYRTLGTARARRSMTSGPGEPTRSPWFNIGHEKKWATMDTTPTQWPTTMTTSCGRSSHPGGAASDNLATCHPQCYCAVLQQFRVHRVMDPLDYPRSACRNIGPLQYRVQGIRRTGQTRVYPCAGNAATTRPTTCRLRSIPRWPTPPTVMVSTAAWAGTDRRPGTIRSSVAVNASHRTPSGTGAVASRRNNGEPSRRARAIAPTGSRFAQGDPQMGTRG